MSEHITEWLNAYLDDELHGSRLHAVKEHLAVCEACQAEFKSLQDLSGLLHEVPAPEFTSPARFAAQVNLRLPQKPIEGPRSGLLEAGWWMIPVGLIAAWILVSTVSIVSNMISAGTNFGLLGSVAASWIHGSSDTVYWTSTLGQFGFLQGDSLQWFEMTERYSRNVLPQFVLQVSIAVLYLTWIAIWWARQTRHQQQQHGQLLEG